LNDNLVKICDALRSGVGAVHLKENKPMPAYSYVFDLYVGELMDFDHKLEGFSVRLVDGEIVAERPSPLQKITLTISRTTPPKLMLDGRAVEYREAAIRILQHVFLPNSQLPTSF